MILYISGPMTGIADHNFPAFREAAARLRAAGYEVSDPSVRGIIDGWSWEDYLRADIRDLMDCDAVALLPGWLESRGASLEVYVAKQLAIPCLSVEYWLTVAPK